MKIQNINSRINFGKTPVMTCTVKKSNTKEKADATLFQLDPNKEQDRNEVKYSKKAHCMYRSMIKDTYRHQPVSEYYFLKDNKTNEVISCAQTSRHYRPDNANFPGLTTLIEEMEDNDKYVNSLEPMFAFLAHKAFKRYDDSLTTGFYTDDISSFKRAQFSQTKNGNWILPQKRYSNLIDTATKRSDIEFLV